MKPQSLSSLHHSHSVRRRKSLKNEVPKFCTSQFGEFHHSECNYVFFPRLSLKPMWLPPANTHHLMSTPNWLFRSIWNYLSVASVSITLPSESLDDLWILHETTGYWSTVTPQFSIPEAMLKHVQN